MIHPLRIYCDTHAGEVFPPRCTLCDALSDEYNSLPLTREERRGESGA